MRMETMSFKEMHDIYVFSCERRQALLDEAMKLETPTQRIQFVADYFLNRLELSQIAKIDGVSENDVVPFKYDYSFLEDYGSDDIRRKEVRRWGKWGYGFNLPQADVDNRKKEQVGIYPSMYAIKLATCIMFASELQRFAYDFGMTGEIVQTLDYCYDNFDGTSTENKKIFTDRLIKMHHFYNVFEVDGKKYKIDIAGLLTAEDFNRNHPELAIGLEDFYFSEDLKKNPFAEIAKRYATDGFVTLSQRQPQ